MSASIGRRLADVCRVELEVGDVDLAVNFEPTSSPEPGELNVTFGAEASPAGSPSAVPLSPQALTPTAMTPRTGSSVNILRFMRLLLTG